MEKLYRFEADFGRMGCLRGLFVADDDIDINPALGRMIHFGEVLGKHSEIMLEELTEEHLTVLTSDADFIAKFEEYRCGSGHNPLDYISCPDCGETLSSPYTKCSTMRCG